MSERHRAVQFRLPTFTRAMKTLAAVFSVVWLLEVLLQGAGFAGLRGPYGLFEPLALVPAAVVRRGHVWQLATYALLHDPNAVVSVVMTVITLWFAGSALEERWGARRTLAMMAVATLVGGVGAIALGFAAVVTFGSVTVSPAAADLALLVAWCALHASLRVSVFGIAELTGQQLLYVTVGIAAVQFVWAHDGATAAGLAGAAVGYAWARSDAPRERTYAKGGQGAKLRVIEGGRGRDLPN